MEILCFAVGVLRRPYCHLRQNRREGHQLGLGNRHPYYRHPVHTWGIVLFSSAAEGIKDIPRHAWVFLVLSGAATGLSWLFYFKALQTGDVSRVAPIDKLSVVITICLSFLFLKEPVTPRVIIGALLITSGSIIMLFK